MMCMMESDLNGSWVLKVTFIFVGCEWDGEFGWEEIDAAAPEGMEDVFGAEVEDAWYEVQQGVELCFWWEVVKVAWRESAEGW